MTTMFFDHLPKQGLICGHRGVRSIAPENTLLAMTKVKNCGAHCWETDVRLSKDGELVVFHDVTLERTTNVNTHNVLQKKDNYRVDQFTINELQMLDAGSWFLTADPFNTLADKTLAAKEIEVIQGQKIPLLREILNFTRIHAFPVNLELKVLDTPSGDVDIVDRVIELLKETETIDMVLLSSFRPEYLYRARELSQHVSIAVLAKYQHPADLVNYLKSFSAVAYHPAIALYDAEMTEQLQRSGFRVNYWTVNDMDQADIMLNSGAGIITDWPQRM